MITYKTFRRLLFGGITVDADWIFSAGVNEKGVVEGRFYFHRAEYEAGINDRNRHA